MLKKVLILAAFASLFACNKEVATADKDPESKSSVKKDANGDEIVPVPFFELAKGDTVSKDVYRLKSKRVDTTTTVLYTTEVDSSSLKLYGDTQGKGSGAYIKYNLSTISRVSADHAPATKGKLIKIPVDLNEYAGGYYIYLYFEKTNYESEALCYIGTRSSSIARLSTPSWPGMCKLGYDIGESGGLWTDVNDGAGGEYIFLEGLYHDDYKNFPFKNSLPDLTEASIRNIMVVGTGQDESTFKSKMSSRYPGWTMVYKDLNEGAGGSYVYLCYKK